jgi:hypothetical protein
LVNFGKDVILVNLKDQQHTTLVKLGNIEMLVKSGHILHLSSLSEDREEILIIPDLVHVKCVKDCNVGILVKDVHSLHIKISNLGKSGIIFKLGQLLQSNCFRLFKHGI